MDAPAVRALSRPRPLSVAVAGVLTWACILGAIAAWVLVPNPVVFVIAFVVVACRQHALNNLVHEASHWNVARRRNVNDLVSDVAFAAPHFISTAAYRSRHARHHAHLGDEERDPEIRYRTPIRGAEFLRFTLFQLSGLGALAAGRDYSGAMAGSRSRSLLLVGVTNGALLAYCVLLGRWIAYPLLWIAPLGTLTPYISALRAIVEHRVVAGAVGDAEAHTRRLHANPIERFVFAPLHFDHHLEHHLVPSVPFSRLPELRTALGHDAPAAGYAATLWRLVTARSDVDGR